MRRRTRKKRNTPPNDNPVLGYHVMDRRYWVMGPPGQGIDPAFGTPERALAAAEAWGRREEVHEVVALHLDGALGVILNDVGDIHADGETALRFAAACRRRGLRVDEAAVRRIDAAEVEPVYSCRALLGASQPFEFSAGIEYRGIEAGLRGAPEFECAVEYDPRRRYTRREMVERITAQRELLCFFARSVGYEQSVLGLDFDRYDARSGSVPVLVMNREQAKVIARAEGRKFAEALRTIRAGRDLLVTYSSESSTGWFRMKWGESEERRCC